MALASFRRDDPGPYPTSPLFATEPDYVMLLIVLVWKSQPLMGIGEFRRSKMDRGQ
jgi:hypothetical protein